MTKPKSADSVVGAKKKQEGTIIISVEEYHEFCWKKGWWEEQVCQWNQLCRRNFTCNKELMWQENGRAFKVPRCFLGNIIKDGQEQKSIPRQRYWYGFMPCYGHKIVTKGGKNYIKDRSTWCHCWWSNTNQKEDGIYGGETRYTNQDQQQRKCVLQVMHIDCVDANFGPGRKRDVDKTVYSQWPSQRSR